MGDLIDRYRFYLATAHNLASNTVEAYAGDVGQFLDWLDGQNVSIDATHALKLGDSRIPSDQARIHRWTAQG